MFLPLTRPPTAQSRFWKRSKIQQGSQMFQHPLQFLLSRMITLPSVWWYLWLKAKWHQQTGRLPRIVSPHQGSEKLVPLKTEATWGHSDTTSGLAWALGCFLLPFFSTAGADGRVHKTIGSEDAQLWRPPAARWLMHRGRVLLKEFNRDDMRQGRIPR